MSDAWPSLSERALSDSEVDLNKILTIPSSFLIHRKL